MKKTLIALMALAGMACGDTAVTYWSFENGTNSAGAKVYTSGEATGTVSTVETGLTTGEILSDDSTAELGKALDFVDGSFVQYSNADLGTTLLYGNNVTLSYTIMAYVMFDGVSGEQFFFGTGSNDKKRGIALGIQDGKVDFLAKTVAHKTFNYTLTADTWYHLAFAYDHTTNKVALFVNGVSEGTVELGASMAGAGSEASDAYVTIGAASNNNQQDNFAGQVAHLQVVTGAALGADAIKQYAASIPEPTTATLSLLALAGLAVRRRRK